MSDRFDEAPPLPREPTALNVPEAMRRPGTAQEADDEAVALPVDAHALPPPPKFPSLTDVALPHAQSAAQSLKPPEQHPAHDQDLGHDHHRGLDHDHDQHRQHSVALGADIEAAIARGAVAPGTGAQKAIKAGQALWTDDDQEYLDQLLAEGQAVYVPPDVVAHDLPTLRSSMYVPVPDPQQEQIVDVSQDTRSVATRIASWNQVVPKEREDGFKGAGVVTSQTGDGYASHSLGGVKEPPAKEQLKPMPAFVPVDFDRDIRQQGAFGTDQTAQGSTQAASRSVVPDAGATTAQKNADVTRTIFGDNFLTVPVTSRKGVVLDQTDNADRDQMIESTTEVMLKSESSAHINVTDDYGLKGGHSSGVNDAAFLDDGKLVTCGNDGKVIIWDMSDHTVECEFEPYKGEAVVMVHPMPQDDKAVTKIIMTLSKSRLLRIWTVDEKQAIMLRNMQIQPSDKDLYMSVPVISNDLKVRATAAAAAAAVTTTDAPKVPAQITKETTVTKQAAPVAVDTAPEPAVKVPVPTEEAVTAAAEAAEEVEEKEHKRFSLSKKLRSFGRSSSSRKAVAS